MSRFRIWKRRLDLFCIFWLIYVNRRRCAIHCGSSLNCKLMLNKLSRTRSSQLLSSEYICKPMQAHLHLSSCLLLADSWITRICAMSSEPPLLPGLFRQTKQSDLSVTSTLQSVNRWRHNEYSCCPHPLPFVQLWGAPVVNVRLVVWRSDMIGEGDASYAITKFKC